MVTLEMQSVRQSDTTADTTSEQLSNEVEAFWEDLKRLSCLAQGHLREIDVCDLCTRCKQREIVVGHHCRCGEVIVYDGEDICFYCWGRPPKYPPCVAIY